MLVDGGGDLDELGEDALDAMSQHPVPGQWRRARRDDVGEVVETALRRASKILAHHRVEVETAPDLPTLAIDDVLFEQALFNLLDNAAKYAPEGTTIRVQVWQEGRRVHLQILDEGDGIPDDDVQRIFDKFYRARKGDRVRAGTGLGLAIARGFGEAMGGTVSAANRTDRRGAAFTLALPVPNLARRVTEAA